MTRHTVGGVTYATVRNLLSDGVPWVADYVSRKSIEVDDLELANPMRVVWTHSFNEEDEYFSRLVSGETLLWHETYGLVIIQSIDLDYS